MADDAPVRLEVQACVATLTLDRPHRRNGVTTELVSSAITAVEQVAADPGVRVLVITGAGGAFCSGMDLGEPVKPDELTFMRRIAQLCLLVHDLPIPTIAKVRGAAIGFGANFALCCDLVVADETAVFGEIFVQRGLVMDGGGSWSLPRRVGLAKAKEILFFGETLDAAEAARVGLVNKVVAAAELDQLVDNWAGRLARGPRRALGIIKAALNASHESSFADALEAETLGQALSFRSPEAKEGFLAFRDKRDPDFTGI